MASPTHLRVSLPARGRTRPLHPPDPSDPKDAWALADTLRGAGAEVQVLDSTIPDVPQPHPFEGCRAMDFGKTVAAVILGVLAAQLILLPLALLLS